MTVPDMLGPARSRGTLIRDDEWNLAHRDETPMQRADRNFAELLQELRILLTSVQILFGFLLTAAVAGAVARLDGLQHFFYVTTIVAATAASMLLVAPVAAHGLMFGCGHKVELVMLAQRAALAGLFGLGTTLCVGFVLVLDLAAGRPAAIGFGVVLLATLLLWVVVPVMLRRS